MYNLNLLSLKVVQVPTLEGNVCYIWGKINKNVSILEDLHQLGQ